MKQYIIAELSTSRNRETNEIVHEVRYYQSSTNLGGLGMSFWDNTSEKAKRFSPKPERLTSNQIAVEVNKDGAPDMIDDEIIAALSPRTTERLLAFEKRAAERKARKKTRTA
ncbi:MAG: hypothetical protein AB7R40_22965 [Nitrospiraceae bacterium]